MDDRDSLLLAAARGEPLHGDVVAALRPTGVMGTLAQMSLSEIMQMMDFGKKTARVDVYLQHAHGSVHVHDGQIVRAEATSTTEVLGEPAFLLLCREKEGFFRIHYERVEIERNVQRPTTFVLLDALRLIDEAAAAAEPTASAVDDALASAFMADTGDEDLQQDPRYQCVLAVLVNGIETVALDIGIGGAFIAMEAPPPKGAALQLRLTARNGAELDLTATVMHALDAEAARAHGRQPGMGVRFDAMTDAERAAVRELIDTIAVQAPSDVIADAMNEAEAQAAVEEKHKLALPASAMLDSLAEVDFFMATGDLKGAQRLLRQMADTPDDDEDVRRRLRDVEAQIEAAEALAYLQHAERNAGKPEAVDLARLAIQLRTSRDVLLRALAVFWRARSHTDIADVAARLLEIDPEDEGALRMWLEANVELKRWTAAIRTVEALLRRRPGDEQMKKLLQRLVQRARGRR